MQQQRTDWRLQGDWIKNCNCAFGCPCDFNARPTQGNCLGLLGMRIERGHFGDVRLDGLSFFVTVDFPGALHEGNGTIQPIIDERAAPEQRDALFQIMSGKHSDEGTLFHIVSLIVTKVLDPVFARIDIKFDMDGRTARFRAGDILETESEPIKNPVSGDEHRALVQLPDGFEYQLAEIASAPTVKSTGGNRFDHRDGHSSLATVRLSNNN